MTHAEPAQSPAEAVIALLWTPTPAVLYGAVLRPLAGRVLLSASTALHTAADACTRARWALDEPTARSRAVAAGHPSAQRPRLGVVPSGIAQGRADLQFLPRPRPANEPAREDDR